MCSDCTNSISNKVAMDWRPDQVKFLTIKGFFINMAREKPIAFSGKYIAEFTQLFQRFSFRWFWSSVKGFSKMEWWLSRSLPRTIWLSSYELFMAEVGTLGRTYHVNVVRLLCPQNESPCLRGHGEWLLDNLLFSENGDRCRIREASWYSGIVVQIVIGLAY